MKKQPCVYMHLNKEASEVFYVGKSKECSSRPYQTRRRDRTKAWFNYVDTNLGGDVKKIKVDVIKCDSYLDAIRLEAKLISEYEPACCI